MVHFWKSAVLASILLSATAFCRAEAQSLSGLKVGDDLSTTTLLNTEPSDMTNLGPFAINKWTLPDENSLSVTSRASTGKIVYIECDWNGSNAGSFSDFPSFYYGRTTLDEIRQHLRSNGFAFENLKAGTPTGDGGIALFNSYAFEENPSVIVTFVTKVTATEIQALKKLPSPASKLGSTAKLTSIILADPSYAGTIWGNNRTYDPRYVDIRWK
ncbi:hypothetical protein BA190_27470 [Labrys sp. WJW]|uniref:hypothetical protein n=1 Tax=Labrys sp. WJW TaxID=1737983 RepID=UPI00082F9277|nr:hypothetical protein [Labrys sp. WJW]OCC01704.1 hypothetical protein BA190_27470 [Labrys sp. WJW]